MITFIEKDLLADISKRELDGIAKKLVELGDPDPITTTIAEQLQKVDDFTRRYALPVDREKRLVRALVLFELYSRLGPIPAKRETKHDQAMKELREIRDGKFPDLPLKDPLPTDVNPQTGNWGSGKKF